MYVYGNRPDFVLSNNDSNCKKIRIHLQPLVLLKGRRSCFCYIYIYINIVMIGNLMNLRIEQDTLVAIAILRRPTLSSG